MTQGAISKYEQSFKNVNGLLEKMKPQFQKVLPSMIPADKLIRVALTTWRGSEKLAECDPLTFAGAVLECAQLALTPDSILGHAHIVPFWNRKRGCYEAQLIVGYKGFIYLARSAGEVTNVQAEVVYAKDDFGFGYGSGRHLNHSWDHKLTVDQRGDPQCAYLFAVLSNGEEHFKIVSWDEILERRDRVLRQKRVRIEIQDGREVAIAKGQGGKEYVTDTPWVTDLKPMAIKTAIRDGAKLMPLCPSLQRAAALDEAADLGLDQGLRASVAQIVPEVAKQLEENLSSGDTVDEGGKAATKTKAQQLRERLAKEQAEKEAAAAEAEQADEEPTDDAGQEPTDAERAEIEAKERDEFFQVLADQGKLEGVTDFVGLTDEEKAKVVEDYEQAEKAKKAEQDKPAAKGKAKGGRKGKKDNGDTPPSQPQGPGPDDDDIPF